MKRRFYDWETHEQGPVDDEDETMVDLGGGMVVPLRELMEDDDDADRTGPE